MIEVEVLYADLSRSRVVLSDIESLPKSRVLAIAVQTDQETDKLKNIVTTHGFDHYALCQKKDHGQIHIMLFGWDDDNFVWRRVTNVHDIDARKEVDIPLGCLNVIFHGEDVPIATWKKALRIFNKEIL